MIECAEEVLLVGFVQCVPLIWVFFVVEGALKRTFDENGNRI